MATNLDQNLLVALKNEIKLQINQNLFDKGVISQEVYELAKIRIVSGT